MPQCRQNPTLGHEDSRFYFGLVTWFFATRGQYAHTIVRGHFLIGGLERGFIGAGTTHAGSCVVWQQGVGPGPDGSERAAGGPDPGLSLSTLGSTGIAAG